MSTPGVILSKKNENICAEELEKLIEEEKSKFVGEVEFDLGVIDSHIYGVAHVKGTLPLVSKPGTYPLENDPSWKKKTEEEAFEIISSWFTKHELNLGYKEKSDEMIRNGIRSVTLVFPPRKLNPRMLAAMSLVTVALYLDDIEEDTGIISEFAGMPMNKTDEGLMKTYQDILHGKYKSLANLPNIEFPLLRPLFWFTFLAYEQLSTDPAYNVSQLVHFIKAASKTYESSLILANSEFLDACSNQIFSEIRQFDAAGGTSLEYVYFCEQIKIPKQVRSDLIFKSCSTIERKIGILVNDLLGLKKDIHLERPINTILRNVQHNGISLIEGVAETIKEIKTMTKDMFFALDLLGKRYPDCDEFIQCTKFVLDGHISVYTLSDNDDESKAKARWSKPFLKKIYY